MTPPPSARSKRAPKVVVERRVSAIATLLATGASRAQIRQAVAKMQRAEADERRRVDADRAVLAALPIAAQGKVPPIEDVAFLWGDDEIPERTVDRYIHDAKDLLRDDAVEAASDRARLLGKLLARGEQLYAAAFQARRFHACHQVWRTTIDLFGLKEIAAMLLPAPGEGEDASTDTRPIVAVENDPAFALPSETRARLLAQLAAGAREK